MPELYASNPEEPDIYSYGYQKNLFKPSDMVSNEIFYNSTINPVNPSSILTGELVSTVRGVVKDEILLGDGSDGDVVISSNTTLTSDKYYNNLIIQGTSTVLTTGGYRIFCKNKFENNGYLRRNGNNGANGAFDSGGTGGAALTAGSLGVSGTGADGGNSPVTSSDGESLTSCLGGAGGNGGVTAADNAGTGGTATQPKTGYRTLTDIVNLFDNNAGILIKGGAGGGGGAYASNDYGGGGGGSGAGIILVSAKVLINNGTIEVLGGNGGDGADQGDPNPDGAGGGGGGGGVIGLLYAQFINSGTMSILGGAAGIRGTTAAIKGSPGRIIEFSLL